jgi:hypothetical protein
MLNDPAEMLPSWDKSMIAGVSCDGPFADPAPFMTSCVSSNAHHLSNNITWVFGGNDIFAGCPDEIADMRG